MTTPLTETETCMRLITPALEQAGWDVQTQIRREYSFTAGRIQVRGRLTHRGDPLRADYVLFRGSIPLAIVEAKRKGLGPANGIQQALDYAEQLDVPFAVASDGTGFHFHDRTGASAEVETTLGMDAIPGPDELWRRYRAWRGLDDDRSTAVATEPYHEDPAEKKEPRYYQRIAIQRTIEAVARGDRRILLVMATGTGKTYTAFQIMHRLWKSGAVKRVLFLADRNILVDQSRNNDFKPFGPVMTKITNRKADPAYQIYLALYQAISGTDEADDVFREFSSDFFDLIVIDECHRGSAKETSTWREVLTYFDVAIHLGLTATPKETNDVSTQTYFGDPIFEYSLKQGIADGFLAPYKVARYELDRDVQGWRPTADMTDDLGEEIEDREYNRKDMEKTLVLNHRTKTVARCVLDYALKVDSHCRTIVFCVDIDHASRMRTALINEVGSRLPGECPAEYVVQITGDNAEGKAKLDDFINPKKRYPVIATTSKLLSTGVDAKDCKLIVIDQEIGSMGEFKQIVGRGTRVDERNGKTWFTIMDFRGATAHFANPEFDGLPETVYEPSGIDDPVDPDDPGTPPDGTHGDDPDESTILPPDPFDPGDGEVNEKARRYRVSGVPVDVLGERIQYLGADGKLITESLTDYSRSRIRGQYDSLDGFLRAWSDADKKQVIVEELENQGVLFEEVAEIVAKKYPGAFDPFDLVCHVAFDQPPLTRRERAESVKKRHVFAQYGEQARRVIEILLDKYADEGLAAVEDMTILSAPPFDRVGAPVELVEAFGGRDGYLGAVRKLESALYGAA
ncbi:MAG: DEAD/DEAH box helicase family protein [Planctomycetota bacterium]